MDTAFFDLDRDVFLGRNPARGPWDPELCHAGPVAAAIARQIELAFGPEKRLARLTIELSRPVPMSGFTVTAEIAHDGRRLGTGRAVLTAVGSGKVCATATATLLRPTDIGAVQAPPIDWPKVAEAGLGDFPIKEARHDLPMFGNQVDILYPPGHGGTPGPTKLWMRTPPLLADEVPSSFQRICPLADCGNAISRNGEVTEFGFLNADLTIHAHRETKAEWILSDSWSYWQGDGIGMSYAELSDENGPIATALQTLVIDRV